MSPPEEIFVLKNGHRLGPFSIDDLLDLVEREEILLEDVCLRQDAPAAGCERVRDVLDWEEPAEAPPEDPEDFDDDGEAFVEDDEDADAPSEAAAGGPPQNPGAILYSGHPSVLSFPRSLTITLIALGAGLWFRDESPWLFLSGIVVALVGASWILLDRSTRLYLITPKRVEIITGLIAKSSNEVRIEDIRTINVRRSGVMGLLGVGTVEFASAGGSTVEVSFENVWAANRIKGLVRRLQDASDD